MNQVSSSQNIVHNVTIQFEARQNLPKQQALTEVLALAPNDGVGLRSFVDSMGGEVMVYRSETLQARVSDPLWYGCQPVGTYQVILQKIPGDSTCFGAIIGLGVDLDENDPGAIDDC